MKGNIKRIYDGIPTDLIKNIVWVEDEYRTNVLSVEPGGTDIVVEYTKLPLWGYDKIKYPTRYIATILRDAEYEIKVLRVYARAYCNEQEYELIPFELIWNEGSSKISILDSLKKYDPIFYSLGKTYKYRVILDSVRPYCFTAIDENKNEKFFTHGQFLKLKTQSILSIISKDEFEIRYDASNFSLYDFINKYDPIDLG